MIIEYNELYKYRKKVIMVDGGFDPLHIGHLAYLEAAAKKDLPVFCNIQSDQYIHVVKKRPSLLPENQRVKLIDTLKPVSYVHLCTTSTHDILEQLQPLKYVKGIDWKHCGLPKIEQEVCGRLSIEIVYLDTNIDSSTNIIDTFKKNLLNEYNHNSQNNIVKKCDSKVNVNAFESYLFSQEEVKPQHYDDHYFMGNWRDGNNDYSIETRRAIEAKNPSNIKEVFQPQRVLDVGCGPGALMCLLHELGIETYGVDFSKAAKDKAPPEVSSKIVIAPVTEYHNFGVTFDLVICRELLEHLTVLQICETVRSLAKYTSKFLYITTRYHPSPKNLLDITDDKVTDPSHITLLNKDFLRVLFVLEGLKSRPDLEQKMDWKNIGRVMVFEKGTK